MKDTKPTVIYIIGDNRSGSTLLDYLLSFYPYSFSVGELHQLNDFFNKTGIGIERNWTCNCGEQVNSCPFWKNIILETSFNSKYTTRINTTESSWSLINDNLFKWSVNKNLNKNEKLGKDFAEKYSNLYHSIYQNTKKRIIIDSSKIGAEAYYLNKYASTNMKFLIIEREVQAVALSKLKRTIENKKFYKFKEKSILRYLITSFKILRKNRAIGDLIRNKGGEVKIIDYNELASQPQKTIDEISKFLNIELFNIPLKTNQQNKQLHTLGGSPSRKKIAPIQIDNRWKIYYKNRPILNGIIKFLNLK